MKKALKLIICIALMFTVAGCGLAKNVSSNVAEKEQVAEKTSEEKIKEFVEENREGVEEISNSTFDITLIAREKSIVYSYTYKQTFTDQQVAAIKTELEKSINSQASVFTNLLTSVREIVPDAKSVIVEYYNGNNTLITSIEFK